jgi:hypothetical protein
MGRARLLLALLALAAGCAHCPCECSSKCGCPCGSASAGQAQAAPKPEGQSLFDGKTLGSWKPTPFGGEGKAEVVEGDIRLAAGVDLTGIHWTGAALPTMNYELSLEARKIEGSDIFCGIAFPYDDKMCSFVAGGWGGSIVGISSIDGMNASENETTKVVSFPAGKWFKIRLRVTPEKIEAWIDADKVVDVATKGREISIHPAMELSKPLGLATYTTSSAFRNISLKRLK